MKNSLGTGFIFESPNAVIITLDQLESQTIPDEFWKLEQITKLKIRKTTPRSTWTTYPPASWYEHRVIEPPFWEIPIEIGKLKNLQSLQLVDLDIRELPSTITQLKELEELNISLNKLDLENELSKIRQLKKLKELTALGNHFDEAEMEKFEDESPELSIRYANNDE